MPNLRRLLTLVALLSLASVTLVHADALVNQVTLVTDAAAAANPVPPPHPFTVIIAGSYTVTLTDLAIPSALSSLQLAVASSSASAAILPAAGSKTVTLQPGTYTAQVLAVAAADADGGSFSVQVFPTAGGSALLSFVGDVGLPNSPNNVAESTLQTQFTITQAGTYQLTLADGNFPATLNSLELIAIPHGVAAPVPAFLLQSAGTVSAPLGAGVYDLIVFAIADSGTQAGLYSVQLSGGGNSVLATTQPVGLLPPAATFNVPNAETVSLQLTDLAYLKSLVTLQAIVTQGATVLQQPAGAGSLSFAAAAGVANLFVWALPDVSAGQGAYAAYAIDSSPAPLLDVARPVVDSNHAGYAFSMPLGSADTYQFRLSDFQIPTAFSALNAVVEQRATSLTTTAAALTTFAAHPGPLNVVVFPTLPMAGDRGLFGLTLTAQATGTVVDETTQGVGAQFTSTTVPISTAGSYVVQAMDLGFPENLGILALIVTRGQTVVGEVFGGGAVTFAVATPGTYVLNVLTLVGSGFDYGLYGLTLAPAATATLSTNVSSVTSGQQVTVTWSSTNATSCSASAGPASGGWSGTLASSGSLAVADLTQTTTFEISCSGNGGSATASTQVALLASPSSSGGGGGAWTGSALLPLALCALGMVRRRRQGACALASSCSESV